jgi:GNAT superfamily N-acetyltransferase
MAGVHVELSRCRVRAARPADAPALARIHVSAWQHAYRGIIAAHNLARTTEVRAVHRFLREFEDERDRSLLHVLDGPSAAPGPIGYVHTGPRRDHGRLSTQGEVFELYLDPDFHGLGGGRKLLSAGLWSLSGRRLLPAWVWVLADNARARRFYAGMGGHEVARGRVRVGDQVLDQVAYAWTDSLPWPEWITAG